MVDEADFLVFEQERAPEILGPDPSYEFVFEVSKAVHEAPVYVASENKLYLSQVYRIHGNERVKSILTHIACASARLPSAAGNRPQSRPSNTIRVSL